LYDVDATAGGAILILDRILATLKEERSSIDQAIRTLEQLRSSRLKIANRRVFGTKQRYGLINKGQKGRHPSSHRNAKVVTLEANRVG
jgi:hypothetical protein